MRGHVRPSYQRDVWDLVHQGLRKADMVELEAGSISARDALQHGYDLSSPHAMTVEVDGVPSAMFGCAADQRFPEIRAGLVWLLGTDRLLEIKHQFLRESRDWLESVTQGYDVVGNLVHHKNTVHIQWLRWLGFSFLGRMGPFIEFGRINPCAT